jgi:hypothetical protein
MARKTRSSRLQRRKSKKRSQSGGGGGFGHSSAESKHWEGISIYKQLYAHKEKARREALKASGKKPGAGDPCTPKYGPFSECEGYPQSKLKCGKPVWIKPGDGWGKPDEYESRCLAEGMPISPQYDVGHFYHPPDYIYDEAVSATLKERGY